MINLCLSAGEKLLFKKHLFSSNFNTLRTGDVDFRFYITAVQDG